MVLGMLLGLGSSCSVADLTSGGPLDAPADQPGDVESGITPAHDAGIVKADGGHRPDAGAVKADSGGASDGAVVPPTTAVSIENLLNFRYLDVASSSTSLGAKVWAWSYTGGTNQLWTFQAMGDGTYEIVNQNSGDCIDVPGDATTNGASMQQYFCWGLAAGEGGVTNVNQRWELVPFEGHVHIVGKGSGKCLGSSTQADGADVYIWECNGDLSEQWAIGQ